MEKVEVVGLLGLLRDYIHVDEFDDVAQDLFRNDDIFVVEPDPEEVFVEQEVLQDKGVDRINADFIDSANHDPAYVSVITDRQVAQDLFLFLQSWVFVDISLEGEKNGRVSNFIYSI